MAASGSQSRPRMLSHQPRAFLSRRVSLASMANIGGGGGAGPSTAAPPPSRPLVLAPQPLSWIAPQAGRRLIPLFSVSLPPSLFPIYIFVEIFLILYEKIFKNFVHKFPNNKPGSRFSLGRLILNPY